jgi:Holliday junction resolvase-like predicted endonuclease
MFDRWSLWVPVKFIAVRLPRSPSGFGAKSAMMPLLMKNQDVVSKLHWGWKIEAQAEAWYLHQSPRAILLARNFRCRLGEIDLIFEEPSDPASPLGARELVFVEVRARLPGSWETGIESVRPKKQLRLQRSMRYFLAHYEGLASGARLDILAWDGQNWTHLRNQWLQ